MLQIGTGRKSGDPRYCTTSFTTATVNNMHDTLTPLGGIGKQPETQTV